MTQSMHIRTISDSDMDAVISLWRRCELLRPWNEPYADIQRARKGPDSTILVGVIDDKIVTTTMVGHDGHRGWMYYVAVDTDQQNKGLGLRMLKAAQDWLMDRGMEKVMLMVRPENERAIGFYRKASYEEEPRIIFAKWLSKAD